MYTNDYIGFLNEDYGIDFGWGPSSMIKYLFEHIHVYSGLPFAGSIIATGAVIRLAMLFTTRASVDNSTKMQALAPLTKPMMTQAQAAMKAGDRMAMQQAQREISNIYKENGIRYYRFIYSFLPIPLGFGCWRTFRNMADVPVAGMSSGGLGWFPDLTIADPLYMLPLMTAALQHFSAKVSCTRQIDKVPL